MKLFTTKNIQILSTSMLVALFIGTSLFFTSCKKEQKGEIDKKAASQFAFYETYQYKEIAQDINKLCETAGDSILLQYKGGVNEHDAIVCQAQESDTAAINAIFEKYGKGILPANLKLMWSLKPDKDLYALIALKTDSKGNPAMSGESLIKAEESQSKNDKRYYTISLTFDKEGGKQFAQLTGANVGLQLAIVFKDKVLSYPFVRAQIDGGTLDISGNFTEQEAKDIVDTLYGKK